jgi:hypothetical protein
MVTSRNRTKVNIPAPLLSTLPKVPLEGELWYVYLYAGAYCYVRCGYDKYEECIRICNEGASDWSGVKFMVFDLPMNKQLPFEERLALLHSIHQDAT